MDNNQLLDEKLKAAGRMEILTNQEGWQDVLNYYEAQIKVFANDLLLSDKPTAEYDQVRQQIKGMRKIIGFVDEHLQILRKFREDEQTRRPTKE